MSEARPTRQPRHRPTWGAAVALCVLVLVIGCRAHPPGEAPTPTERPPDPIIEGAAIVEHEAISFTDYGPAAPTVLFVAGLKGYIEPCGCTAGLHVGGLDKVAGLAGEVADLQPASLVLDGGNMLFGSTQLDPHMGTQDRAQASLIVAAHRHLGTVATTPGPYDFAAGLAFYQEALADSGITVISANLSTSAGVPLGIDGVEVPLAEGSVGVVGAADPALFAPGGEVRAVDPAPVVQAAADRLSAGGAKPILLLYQGSTEGAESLMERVSGIDFVVVGYDPQETDEVMDAGSASLLQAYDQGRYLGVLKLFPGPESGPWGDARREDRATIERIDRRLSYLRTQLELLPPSLQGEEPEIILTMRGQVEDLVRERAAARNSDLVFDDSNNRFLYWPVAVEPGYGRDEVVGQLIEEHNQALREMNAGLTQIPPLGPGEVAFTGAAVCRECHEAAYQQWLDTGHGRAMPTLELRNKQFDVGCVSCHVTGFHEPGGSVTGNHNGLSNVQCESCHGRGEAHRNEPPGHIVRDPEPSACTGCHSPEHSPHFAFESYRPLILGPGHGEDP